MRVQNQIAFTSQLNIDYAVDDKLQCTYVYLFLIQDIIVVQCGNIVIRSRFRFGTDDYDCEVT